MEINCTTCGVRIPAEDMNLDRMVAKCRICNTVFDFSAQLATEAAVPQRRRPFVNLPARMEIIVDARRIAHQDDYRHAPGEKREITIARRWFEPGRHLPLLFFCLFWDGFLVHWYTALASGTAHTKSGATPGLTFFLFPLLHVGVGVFLTYSVIAGLFNTTLVGIRGDDLFVSHGPIPWRGNRTIPAASITQLFCEEKVSRSNKNETLTYSLTAILDGGERVQLLTGLTAVEQALFLEQTLEERLEIVDVAVAGEVRA
jgi:hypothetical protein